MSQKQNGLETVAPETQALTNPEGTPKQAGPILDDAMKTIHAQGVANICYDLIVSGAQAPDFLNDILGQQEYPRAFLAAIQKRIVKGARR